MDQPTVLVVDDSSAVLAMVERFLGACGFRIVSTDAPFAVLQMIRDESPDVLVLDLMIPGLDGDALARFAGNEVHVPVVFYTAANDASIEEVQKNHPGAEVVRKGVPLTELEAAVRRALGQE